MYQLGWRLGGKGASGRRMSQGARIEEHGLHIWFGFYDNAFRLMREAYSELRPNARGRPARDASTRRSRGAATSIVLYDRQGDGWHGFAFNPPRNLQRPGVPRGAAHLLGDGGERLRMGNRALG